MITKQITVRGVTYLFVRVYPIYEGNPNEVCDFVKDCYTKKEALDEIRALKKRNPGKNYWTKRCLGTTPYYHKKEAK